MPEKEPKSVAVIVAHPDDETLWAGGTMLSYPEWDLFTVCLCRGGDPDRSPRFYEALKMYHSKGAIADLDDSPEQPPLDKHMLEQEILKMLPARHFELIITHNPSGEYTRHRRHEEVSEAVIDLWLSGRFSTDELWTFAYEDGQNKYLPKAMEYAPIYRRLSPKIANQKYQIITQIYGFSLDSWEARATSKTEAFWRFTSAIDAKNWLDQKGVQL
jgi:LmbE family N-acetylglucosaminyl deacetylase